MPNALSVLLLTLAIVHPNRFCNIVLRKEAKVLGFSGHNILWPHQLSPYPSLSHILARHEWCSTWWTHKYTSQPYRAENISLEFKKLVLFIHFWDIYRTLCLKHQWDPLSMRLFDWDVSRFKKQVIAFWWKIMKTNLLITCTDESRTKRPGTHIKKVNIVNFDYMMTSGLADCACVCHGSSHSLIIPLSSGNFWNETAPCKHWRHLYPPSVFPFFHRFRFCLML